MLMNEEEEVLSRCPSSIRKPPLPPPYPPAPAFWACSLSVRAFHTTIFLCSLACPAWPTQFSGREYSCDNATGKGLSGLEECAEGGTGTVTGQNILDEFG